VVRSFTGPEGLKKKRDYGGEKNRGQLNIQWSLKGGEKGEKKEYA